MRQGKEKKARKGRKEGRKEGSKEELHSSLPQTTEAAQLNEIGPKAYIGTCGCCYMDHAWPRKCSVQKVGKPEYPEKKPRNQREIDKSQPTCRARESIPGCRGVRCKWWPLRQPDSPEAISPHMIISYSGASILYNTRAEMMQFFRIRYLDSEVVILYNTRAEIKQFLTIWYLDSAATILCNARAEMLPFLTIW